MVGFSDAIWVCDESRDIIYIYTLIGGLEHELYDFPYIGINKPNWLSYFSEGLKPPTSTWYIHNMIEWDRSSEWRRHRTCTQFVSKKGPFVKLERWARYVWDRVKTLIRKGSTVWSQLAFMGFQEKDVMSVKHRILMAPIASLVPLTWLFFWKCHPISGGWSKSTSQLGPGTARINPDFCIPDEVWVNTSCEACAVPNCLEPGKKDVFFIRECGFVPKNGGIYPIDLRSLASFNSVRLLTIGCSRVLKLSAVFRMHTNVSTWSC